MKANLFSAITRLVNSDLDPQQQSDLEIILRSFQDNIEAANKSTNRALEAQELTQLKLAQFNGVIH